VLFSGKELRKKEKDLHKVEERKKEEAGKWRKFG